MTAVGNTNKLIQNYLVAVNSLKVMTNIKFENIATQEFLTVWTWMHSSDGKACYKHIL